MENELRLKDVILSLRLALLDVHDRALRMEDCIFSDDKDLQLTLQNLDYVLQSIHALSEFSTGVAAEISDDHQICVEAALKKIPLASLSRLLSGAEKIKTEKCEKNTKVDAGFVDLF